MLYFMVILFDRMGCSEFKMNANQKSWKHNYIYAALYSAWQSWSPTTHPGKETSGYAIYTDWIYCGVCGTQLHIGLCYVR